MVTTFEIEKLNGFLLTNHATRIKSQATASYDVNSSQLSDYLSQNKFLNYKFYQSKARLYIVTNLLQSRY